MAWNISMCMLMYSEISVSNYACHFPCCKPARPLYINQMLIFKYGQHCNLSICCTFHYCNLLAFVCVGPCIQVMPEALSDIANFFISLVDNDIFYKLIINSVSECWTVDYMLSIWISLSLFFWILCNPCITGTNYDILFWFCDRISDSRPNFVDWRSWSTVISSLEYSRICISPCTPGIT
jgi:hypothetical protein